jgi:hypothetical protein
VRFEGGGGTGATAKAVIAYGKVTHILVTNTGNGYTTAPSVIIEGPQNEISTPAAATAILGNGLVRTPHIRVKFDRLSGKYTYETILKQTLHTGTGAETRFNLPYPIDLNNDKVQIFVDGIEQLRSKYTYSNVEDNTSTYTREKGRIIFAKPPSLGAVIEIKYQLPMSMLSAEDRILHSYNPSANMYSRELSQLMSGIDYGGVEVRSFDFQGVSGWDTRGWFSDQWDQFDNTFEDEVFIADGSTIAVQLSAPLEDGAVYNLYKNGVRIDATDFVAGTPAVPGVPAVPGAPADAEYNNGALITENNGTVFDRALTVNGLKLVVAGAVGGQLAVPDEWAKKTARAFELMTDPNGAGINTTHQRNFLKTLRGDVGTYHAGLPTIQRVGYGGGSTYTPNWLLDVNVASYAGLQAFNDSVAQKDMVWYKNNNGNNPPTQRRDIEEIFEHIFHTIHAFGIPGAVPGSIDAVEMNPDIRINNEPSFDWKNTAIHLAMKEAIDAGLYDPSGYAPDWNTDPEKAAVAYTEYTYLVNWSMWDMSVYWNGGSLAPEWDDSLKTPAGMLANNPLGYALFNTYFAPVLSKPDFATIESIFGENDTGVSGYVVDALVGGTPEVAAIPEVPGSSATNVNAITNSITGDGVTDVIYVQDLGIEILEGDLFVVRKITSDGSIIPDETGYDTALSGGDLLYTSATGVNAEDIITDGDGFISAAASAGPEELVPGQIFDTLDIKVYTRESGGQGKIFSQSYRLDTTVTTYELGVIPSSVDSIIVKIDNVILSRENADYTINWKLGTVTIDNTIPSFVDNATLSIVTVAQAGQNILDFGNYIADESTITFETQVKFQADLDIFVSVDGVKQTVTFNESLLTGNVTFTFDTVPTVDSVIYYALFDSNTQINYSQMKKDTFTGNGSTVNFTLSSAPFYNRPTQHNLIVKVGNNILSPGYNVQYTIPANSQREYLLETFQNQPGSLLTEDIKVFLNGTEIFTPTSWRFDIANSSVVLTDDVGIPGDIVELYVITDGEYTLTSPTTVTLTNAPADEATVEIFQFSNHDILGIERINYNVVSRVTLQLENPDYNTYNRLSVGEINLRVPAIDSKYVWVIKNGILLTPDVDYAISDSKNKVQLAVIPDKFDTIDVMHFTAEENVSKFSYRQFKDILNRTHFKRLDASATTLAQPLNYYDLRIEVTDSSLLSEPNKGQNLPGIIFINGERIEYFVKEGNLLRQIRRGTLGTGIKETHAVGSKVFDQNISKTIPYSDSNIVQNFTADGVTALFDVSTSTSSINELEVFVAGQRMRKNSINTFIPVFELDSPEGDYENTAEVIFNIETQQIELKNVPVEGSRVTIIKKQGKIWNEGTKSLGKTENAIARFLRAGTSELPE